MGPCGGAAPRFFVADTTPVVMSTTGFGAQQLSMLFDSSTSVPGEVQGNTITITVPYTAIPAAKTSGVLYSATAFTATTAATLAGNPEGALNVTDLTVPLDVNLAGGGSTAAFAAIPSGWSRIPLGLAIMGLLAWCAWRSPGRFQPSSRRPLRTACANASSRSSGRLPLARPTWLSRWRALVPP